MMTWWLKKNKFKNKTLLNLNTFVLPVFSGSAYLKFWTLKNSSHYHFFFEFGWWSDQKRKRVKVLPSLVKVRGLAKAHPDSQSFFSETIFWVWQVKVLPIFLIKNSKTFMFSKARYKTMATTKTRKPESWVRYSVETLKNLFFMKISSGYASDTFYRWTTNEIPKKKYRLSVVLNQVSNLIKFSRRASLVV